VVPPVGRGVLCGNAAFLMVMDFFSAIYEGRTSTRNFNTWNKHQTDGETQGGGNSNMFYFHPDPWRKDPF